MKASFLVLAIWCLCFIIYKASFPVFWVKEKLLHDYKILLATIHHFLLS